RLEHTLRQGGTGRHAELAREQPENLRGPSDQQLDPRTVRCLELDAKLLCLGSDPSRLVQQLVHIEPVAAIGRHPTSRGVGVAEVPLLFEVAHGVADRCRGNAQLEPAGDRSTTRWLRRFHVRPYHRLEDAVFAIGEGFHAHADPWEVPEIWTRAAAPSIRRERTRVPPASCSSTARRSSSSQPSGVRQTTFWSRVAHPEATHLLATSHRSGSSPFSGYPRWVRRPSQTASSAAASRSIRSSPSTGSRPTASASLYADQDRRFQRRIGG